MHNGDPEVASGRQGEIPIEDLHCAIVAMKENDMELIVAATRSPFNLEIREARLPEGFKLLAINADVGKSDPQDHLDHFNDLMEIHLASSLPNVRFFPSP